MRQYVISKIQTGINDSNDSVMMKPIEAIAHAKKQSLKVRFDPMYLSFTVKRTAAMVDAN